MVTFDSLCAASLGGSANNDELTRERWRGPISLPQQLRSVRPRLILDIDSDSD
jgi:hypothetical protein